MNRYRNLGGDSNVEGYGYGTEYIRVRFRDGSEYVYTYQSAGRDNVERAKALADAGRGLNAYINTRMKHLYSRS